MLAFGQERDYFIRASLSGRIEVSLVLSYNKNRLLPRSARFLLRHRIGDCLCARRILRQVQHSLNRRTTSNRIWLPTVLPFLPAEKVFELCGAVSFFFQCNKNNVAWGAETYLLAGCSQPVGCDYGYSAICRAETREEASAVV